MKNWTIGVRMAASFGLIIAIVIGLGLFAYTKVENIDRNAAQITKSALPGVFIAGKIQNNVHAIYALLVQHIVSTDDHEMRSLESQMRDIRAETTPLIDQYEKLLSSDKERALFEDLKSERAAFWTEFEPVLKMSQIGTVQTNVATMKLANTSLKPIWKRYVQAADDLVTFNRGGPRFIMLLLRDRGG